VRSGLLGAVLAFAKTKRMSTRRADTGARHSTTTDRMLWCAYFVICFFFLYWPFNALSLLFGIFLKQRTAARYARR
jgi:hypothetical protein